MVRLLLTKCKGRKIEAEVLVYFLKEVDEDPGGKKFPKVVGVSEVLRKCSSGEWKYLIAADNALKGPSPL